MKLGLSLGLQRASGSVLIPDPVITSASTANVAEGGATLALTLTADNGPVTWTIVGGDDQALFTIANDDELHFSAQKDKENPVDANYDNVYKVTVRATNAGGTDDMAIEVTVTNVTGELVANYNGVIGTLTPGAGEISYDAATLRFILHKTTANAEAWDEIIEDEAIDGRIVKLTAHDNSFELFFTVTSMSLNSGTWYHLTFDTTNNTHLFGSQTFVDIDGKALSVEFVQNQIMTINYDATSGGQFKTVSDNVVYNHNITSAALAQEFEASFATGTEVVASPNSYANHHRLVFDNITPTQYSAADVAQNTLYVTTNTQAAFNVITNGAAATNANVSFGIGSAIGPVILTYTDINHGTFSVVFNEYGLVTSGTPGAGWYFNDGSVGTGSGSFTKSTAGATFAPNFTPNELGSVLSQSNGSDAVPASYSLNMQPVGGINSGYIQLQLGAPTISIQYSDDATAIDSAWDAAFYDVSVTGTGSAGDPFIITATTPGLISEPAVIWNELSYPNTNINFTVTNLT